MVQPVKWTLDTTQVRLTERYGEITETSCFQLPRRTPDHLPRFVVPGANSANHELLRSERILSASRPFLASVVYVRISGCRPIYQVVLIL